MNGMQNFGGEWTVEKLNILSEYLDFYLTALQKQRFKKIYVDAFAGSGGIWLNESGQTIEGSARLALKTTQEFDQYVFIEKSKHLVSQLQEMIRNEFPQRERRVKIYPVDCNEVLLRLCRETDWSSSRALVFLDPYSMDVKWNTLKAIAKTRAMDMWYLFPLSAANRLIRKDGMIDEAWQARLNDIFGESKWFEEFYRLDPQLSIFWDDGERCIKSANAEALTKYILRRLSSIFPCVANNPRTLYNSKKSPLFLFCFAVSNPNPRAKELAMRGALHILNNSGRRA